MNKITTKSLPTFMNERGVGFDNLLNLFEDTVAHNTYPPYNVIQVNDDDYLIEVAIAGFGKDDVEIIQDENKLRITGAREADENEDPKYLHRGISSRSFKREFVLSEYVSVVNATFENGILTVALHRDLPEKMKPRTIKIK